MLDISIENLILPDKPFNTFELEDAAKRLKIPSFRGFLLHYREKRVKKNVV